MKIVCLSALLGSCVSSTGSSASNSSETKTDDFDYASLYRSTIKQYDEEARKTSMASNGYLGNDIQGYNGWYYLAKDREGSISQMEYAPTPGLWEKEGASLQEETMASSFSFFATREYVSPFFGEATIYGQLIFKVGNQKKAVLRIYKNGSSIGESVAESGIKHGRYFEFHEELKEGDKIDFILESEGKVTCNPTVSFEESQNSSLYSLTPFGKYYGDMYPYYDMQEHLLYNYYLWSDDARSGKYHHTLDISHNLLTFENVPEENNYDLYQKYYHEGNLSMVFDVSRFIDVNKYSFLRDNALYHDTENKRYLLIGGCYYSWDNPGKDNTSDLVIYASEDDMALSWNQNGNNVASNYVKNLPECPALLKIGNRWYPFVSVAYNTVHQVGPLQYWVGDEEADCMDQDWGRKPFRFLDGEDLCAARPFPVGDKTYMLGWIPRTYDTMPWSPWGGYRNLPREVIQHKDGSLGGRLDPYLRDYLSYGNISAIDQSGAPVDGKQIGTNLKRNYITFHLVMNGASEAYYEMRQGTNVYRAGIKQENGKAYLRVTSPNDPRHKVNSYNEIPAKDSYELRIVNDGEFIETFVDDEYALTAHTSMKDEEYDAYVGSSNGKASFSDIQIDKLLPYRNIE